MGEKVYPAGDRVVLRTERGLSALPLLRVVIGGLASRHDLSVEQLDDLQLAVESLLAEEPPGGGSIILEIWSEGDGLALRIHGLLDEKVRTALMADEPLPPATSHRLDVRLLLESLLDSFSADELPGGGFAVRMDKRA